MRVVIIEMRKPNGKLVRTFRESFSGPLVGGRDAAKVIALRTITERCGKLFPGNVFVVRNSNL